ncbi:MAG: efflux RND transporter periplasmic adaptor subunit [Pseudomonadota bacterium]
MLDHIFKVQISIWLLLYAATIAAQDLPVVQVAPAEKREIASTLWVPGTVVSRQDAILSAETEGQLLWIAELGQEVAKGDVIARIDDRTLKLELRRNLSSAARIKAELAYQNRQINRLEELTLHNNSSRSELDQAKSQSAMLEQDLKMAQIAIETSQLLIEKTSVKAPFPGVIANRELMAGEFTESGSNLLRLVNTKQLELSARAPITIARYAKTGMQLTLRTENNYESGALRTLIPVGDERTRMLEARVTLADSSLWVIGEAVQLALTSSDVKSAIAVHRDALILRDTGVSVFKVAENNIARQLHVKPGASSGDYIAISGAIQSNDQLVIRGAENLSDGQEVHILPADSHSSELSHAEGALSQS